MTRTLANALGASAAVAAAAALTSGCGGGTDAPSPAKDPPLVTYANSFLSFSRPATWTAYPFRWSGELHFRPMLYLSTQRVQDPCRTDGDVTTCAWPVQRLEPGGVLIAWENRGSPDWSLESEPGSALTVGRRSAKRAELRPGACAAIGGDLTIEVAIAQPLLDNWTEATACLRGPDLAENEQRVDALLASTRFLPQ